MLLRRELNTNTAILGAVIALLKVKSLSIKPVALIQEGLRTARLLNIEDDLMKQGRGKPKTFRTGNRDNVTAGTALRLTEENIAVPEGARVTMIAKPGNSGVIYFANSKEECEDSDKRFDGLDAGLAHSFNTGDVRDIWFDAATSGEGISWYVEQ